MNENMIISSKQTSCSFNVQCNQIITEAIILRNKYTANTIQTLTGAESLTQHQSMFV